jgi:MYXO-CTERM domain-containing protein
MKLLKLIKPVVMSLACVAAMPALATQVAVSQVWGAGYPTANLHHYTVGTGYDEVVAGFRFTYNNQTFAGFCMEYEQSASATTDYTIGAYTNDAFSRLFAVSGFNGTNYNNDGVNTSDKEAALQLAIWEVLYDGLNGSLSNGHFWVDNVSNNGAALTLAQSYLTSAAALQSGQYLTDKLIRYSNPNNQDMISSSGSSTVAPTVVPEPETALMWLGGVAALAAWRRRQTRRVAA